MPRRRIALPVALAASLALLLSGCGSRADRAEIVAGAGGGPVQVSLPPEVERSLTQRAATAAGADPAAPPQTGDTQGAVPAAGAPRTTNTTPSGTAPGKDGTATQRKGAAPQAAVPAGAQPAAAPGAGPCTRSLDPVAIGQIGTFSGVAGPIAASSRNALAAWVKDINARGGLACHPVVLYAQDDGGDPARAASLVRQLKQQRKVVALVGNGIVFSASGFRSAVEAEQLPAIGGDLVAPDWHRSPWMFPQGASIEDQIVGFMKQGVDAGKKKLAVMYCVEVSACTNGIKTIQDGGARTAGAELVYSTAISLTQTDFTAQCQNAKNAGADQLALGMDGSAMGRVARSCAALGYRPVLSGIGGVISPAQAEDANLRAFTLAVASGNAPWTETSTPGLREYQQKLAQLIPGQKPDGASIIGWSSGKLLEAAVAKVAAQARSGTLTTELIVSGLHKLRGETLGGLTSPITFRPGKPAPSSGCVFFELLTEKGWTAPRGAKPVCNLR
jgi:branched-chain amino acid transport system substrate-binding protein